MEKGLLFFILEEDLALVILALELDHLVNPPILLILETHKGFYLTFLTDPLKDSNLVLGFSLRAFYTKFSLVEAAIEVPTLVDRKE